MFGRKISSEWKQSEQLWPSDWLGCSYPNKQGCTYCLWHNAISGYATTSTSHLHPTASKVLGNSTMLLSFPAPSCRTIDSTSLHKTVQHTPTVPSGNRSACHARVYDQCLRQCPCATSSPPIASCLGVVLDCCLLTARQNEVSPFEGWELLQTALMVLYV